MLDVKFGADSGQRLDLLRAIEAASVRFWPAHETQAIGGWLWRYSNGGSQRANSVATLADPGIDFDRAIAAAEALYDVRGAPAQFQITEVSAPPGLDRRLAARGYQISDPCTTLVHNVTSADDDAAAGPGVMIAAEPTAEWFDTYAGVITDDRRAQAQAILDRVPAPRAFIGLRREDVMVATALCVAEGEIARVKCVATRDAARRTGAAEAVMKSARCWAASRGARTIALGVSAANAPAQGLYAKLGFVRAGLYHIRVKHILKRASAE